MNEIITKEIALAAGFKDLHFKRYAIKCGHATMILTNDQLYISANVICNVESEEHLKEILAALRATPIDV